MSSLFVVHREAAAKASPEEAGTTCQICGHPFDPHAVVTTGGAPVDGGIMLCPVDDWGCDCISTWAAPPYSTRETVRIPDEKELSAIREILQNKDNT